MANPDQTASSEMVLTRFTLFAIKYGRLCSLQSVLNLVWTVFLQKCANPASEDLKLNRVYTLKLSKYACDLMILKLNIYAG